MAHEVKQDVDMEGSMKRPHDEESGRRDDGGHKRRRGGDGPRSEVRVLLQSKNAGAIIGKQGSNIKRLRSEYNANVTVPDSNGPERILTISSELDSALDCLLDVIPNLEDYQQYKDLDFDCELRLLIHQSQAGCIIGRAGFKIKELREKTGANIKVYSKTCPESTDRIVQLSGKPETVVNCIRIIYELLETAPPKGPVQPYDPHNYDEYFSQEYGGYTLIEGGKGKGGRGMIPRGMAPPPRGGLSARSGFGGGGMGMGDMDDYSYGRVQNRGGNMGRSSGPPSLMGSRGGRNMRDDNSMGGGMGGRSGGMRGGMNSNMGRGMGSRGFGNGSNFGGEMGGSGGGGGFSRGSSEMNFTQDSMVSEPESQRTHSRGGMGQQGMMFGGNEPTNSTQVTIPKDCAGAIIGKKGSRITEIRRQSRASIVIDEPMPGSNDRIITISGTQEQIQNAQYLLQMSVRQSEGKSF
ncbi:heterogeneous nuclear ribonucleoprotein K-like isoform X2 [Liolophura sinensis]|uniref:heterogeneous nuclear ribonucleoprotein K-like isoform X2 n=1 Tax=Liolophura sinensis TaxID=3198878 RepID=UPI003158F463